MLGKMSSLSDVVAQLRQYSVSVNLTVMSMSCSSVKRGPLTPKTSFADRKLRHHRVHPRPDPSMGHCMVFRRYPPSRRGFSTLFVLIPTSVNFHSTYPGYQIPILHCKVSCLLETFSDSHSLPLKIKSNCIIRPNRPNYYKQCSPPSMAYRHLKRSQLRTALLLHFSAHL